MLRAAAAVVGALLAVMAAAAPLRAQGGLSTEGALFLLVPVGARTVGFGQAAVVAEAGTESLWGNPAGIARITRPEAALLTSKTVVADGMAVGLVFPAGKAGVLGLGARLYDYGVQDNTDRLTGETIGQIIPRAVVLAATYSATITKSLRAGLTYERVQSRVDCSGPCGSGGTEPFKVSTSAVDAGLQFQAPRPDSLTFGLMVRSMGLKLQVYDISQSDPLPTRLHLGVGGRMPRVAAALAGAAMRWAEEIVNRTSLDQPAVRLGAELGLQKQLFLRAGYASGTGESTGPAIGLGFVRGALGIDFARVFGGFSSDAGQPPTFLTLRVNW